MTWSLKLKKLMTKKSVYITRLIKYIRKGGKENEEIIKKLLMTSAVLAGLMALTACAQAPAMKEQAQDKGESEEPKTKSHKLIMNKGKQKSKLAQKCCCFRLWNFRFIRLYGG